VSGNDIIVGYNNTAEAPSVQPFRWRRPDAFDRARSGMERASRRNASAPADISAGGRGRAAGSATMLELVRARILAVLVFLVGCEKVEQNAPDCKASADELAAFLAASDHERPILWDSELDRLHLVMRTDLPRGAVARAPIVEVSVDLPDRVVHNGEQLSLHDLAEHLADDARAIADGVASGPSRELTPIQRTRLVLAIDQRAAWGVVAGVAEVAASAGFDHIAFLFERPAATAPPPRTAIDDEMDALASRQHPTDLASDRREREARFIASKLIRSCESVPRLLDSIGRSSGDRAEMLIRGISAALVECKCDVDMPSLRSQLWQRIGTRHPTSALEITLLRAARRIDRPAATPWREVSQQLRPGQTVWLVAH
jgi:biopolymer transport protein ExbD